MQTIFSFFVFLFGLIVGSFLNCVIYRMGLQEDLSEGRPRRKAASFLRGRSYCPKCKHTLGWADLIPIISYIMLAGRCRYCKKSISLQYPLVELATGLAFLAVFNPDHATRTGYLFLISCFLIIIFVYDLRHYIIPDKIVFSAIGAAFAYNLFSVYIGDYSWAKFFSIIIAGFFPALFFFSLFIISRGKWMGFGDVKLAFFMGLFLGFPKILAALFLAFSFGGIIGIWLVILGKKKMKSEVPFGPFLIAGTFLAMLFGQSMINWYLNLLVV
jgi:prepilin signal peptidase PulO-like enzyme (type II secretory pathway)